MKRPSYPSHRTYSPDARPMKSAQQLRALWADAVDAARVLAPVALGHEDTEASARAAFGVGITRFSITLRDLRPETFPSPAWSARQMAGAFLILAHGFVQPAATPDARTAFAPVLIAAAAELDRVLHQLRADASHTWRGQTGERDED